MTVWVPFYCDNKVLDGRQYFQIGNVIIAIRPTFMKYIFRVDLNESETTKEPTCLLGNHEKKQKYGSQLGHKQRDYTVSCCPIRGCQKTFTKDEFLLDHIMKKHIFTENLKQGSRITADEHKQSADMENSMKGSKITEDEPKQSGDMENVNHNTDKSTETEEAINLKTELKSTEMNRKCGGGNGDGQEEIDHVNLQKRCDVYNIHIPDIKISNTELFLHQADDIVINDPKTSMFMPPAIQVEKLTSKFKTDLSLKTVQLDYGMFDRESINYFKTVHSYKHLLQKVLAEENWFSDIPDLDCQSPLSSDNIKTFKNLLLHNPDSKVINMNSKQIEIRDLSDICCDRWLNDGVISNLIYLMNKDISHTKCLVRILNSMVDMQNLADTVRQTFSSHFDGVRIAFCTHVGNVNGYSFLDSCIIDDVELKANHFTSCVYSFDSNQLVYCDPLGRSIPDILLQKISEFLHYLQIQNFSVFHCHDPDSFIQSENFPVHVCSNNCSPVYFIQQCSAICGVASLVSLVIMSYEWTMFEEMVNSTSQFHCLAYLRNISSFSKFLRLVIIDWLICGSIEIKKILKTSCSISESITSTNDNAKLNLLKYPQTESEQQMTCMKESTVNSYHCNMIETNTESNILQKEYVAEKLNANQSECSDSDISKSSHKSVNNPKGSKNENLFSKWQLDGSYIERYICRKPEVSYIKSKGYVRLRLKLVNSKDISKTFRCNNDPDSARGQIQAYLSSDECTNWVKMKNSDTPVNNNIHITDSFPGINDQLTRPYQLTYVRDKLRVRCFLRNGHTKDKYFPCSKMGKDDLEAVKSVKMFFKTKECLDWLLSSDTWIKTGTVPVGSQTKQYINAINFDVTKQYIIHKDVEKIYDPETLSVSVTENKKWGKTNRTDQIYQLQTTEDFTAVTLYIKCSSKSDICRGDCGIILNSHEGVSDICPKCNKNCSDIISNECHNCKSTSSSQWAKDQNGNTVCKSCYQYHRRNKKFKSNIVNIPKAVIKSHYTCKWQLKLVMESNDLSVWHIYESGKNSFYHPVRPVQESRRANLQTRDTWDILRTSIKATPQQIFSTENRANPIRVSTIENSYHNLKKIKSRCRVVDQHYLKSGIKTVDEIPINSDWRTCEKILEGDFQNVLMFQRGNDQLRRCYHIVLCRDDNTHHLREFGQHILGYDIKQDFMSARFKTACLTYTDTVSNGRAGAVAVCNCEDENSHSLTLQIVLSNIPCERTECRHERKLYIYNDNSGFFWQRECALFQPLCPLIQHDKAQDIRNAVIHQNFESTLCNFHALKAYRSFIRDNSELELFIRPLETAFKCILRSWNKTMTENLIERYKHFVHDLIPSQLMSVGAKTSLITYLDKQWFSNCWLGVFTAEVFQHVPLSDRRDPLLLTDNITERKFKEFDENDFSSHLNRSIALLVMKFLNNILYREVIQTKESKSKTRSCPDKTKETTLAMIGINIALHKKVITYDNWKETGWALVTSETSTVPNLSDDFFVSSPDEDNNISPDIPQPTSNVLDEIQKNSSSLVREHGYSVVDRCKRIVADLNMVALNMFFQENLSYLPLQLQPLVKKNTHICNIKLCTCTCFHFIVRGQPYFCKHLYGCLAEFYNVYNDNELVKLYLKTYPSFPLDVAPYLTKKVVPSPVFDKVQQLMNISHLATEDEINAAKEGKILKNLHTAADTGTIFTGRPAQRRAHNAGFRSVHGPTSARYPLVDAEVGLQDDPYKPKVKFPENSRERHGGRKVKTLSKRGVSFSTIMNSAMKKLGLKIAIKSRNSSKVTDTFNEPCNRSDDIMHSQYSQIDNNDASNNITDGNSNNAPKQQQPKSASMKQKNNYILCAKCINEGSSLPFTCASKPELDKHMSSKHKEDNYLCAYCYNQYKTLTYFATDRQLKQHQKDHQPLNVSTDQTISASTNNGTATPHLQTDRQPRAEQDQTQTLSNKLNALDTASPRELNELSASKEPGIANLAKMKLNQIEITHKTASDLLKEKENEVTKNN